MRLLSAFRVLVCIGLLACLCGEERAQGSKSLESLYREAREALARNEYARAADAWKAILAVQPGLAEAHSNLAMMYHLQNAFEMAIPEFQSALKLNPRLSSARLVLGIDYYLTGQPRLALEALTWVVQQEPRNATAVEWLGMSSFQLGNYFASAQHLERAVRLGEGNEAVVFHMARAYQRLAQAEYLLVFRRAPDSVWECLIKSDQYMVQNNVKQALALLDQALRVAPPEVAGIWLRRARLYEKEGDYNKAFQSYRTEWERYPARVEAARALLQFLHKSRFTEEAALLEKRLRERFGDRLADFVPRGVPGPSSLAQLDPSVKEVVRGLASSIQPLPQVTTWQKQVQRALDREAPTAADRILKSLQPAKAQPDRLYWKGRLLAASGDWQAALTQLVKLSSQTPDNPEVHYYAGLWAERLAFDALQSFTEKFPGSFRIPQIEAEYFLSASQPQKAMEAYRKALAIYPKAVQIHLALGDIYLQQSDYQKASAEYEQELGNDRYSLAALEKLGNVYLLMRQPGQAKTHLAKYLGLRPNTAGAHRLLGKALFMESDFEASVTHFEKALKLEATDDETVYFQLSRSLQRLGREAEAKSHLQTYQRLLEEKSAAARSRIQQATETNTKAEKP